MNLWNTNCHILIWQFHHLICSDFMVFNHFLFSHLEWKYGLPSYREDAYVDSGNLQTAEGKKNTLILWQVLLGCTVASQISCTEVSYRIGYWEYSILSGDWKLRHQVEDIHTNLLLTGWPVALLFYTSYVSKSFVWSFFHEWFQLYTFLCARVRSFLESLLIISPLIN